MPSLFDDVRNDGLKDKDDDREAFEGAMDARDEEREKDKDMPERDDSRDKGLQEIRGQALREVERDGFDDHSLGKVMAAMDRLGRE